ncbi:SDR family NAD(P)-dependent oxidoreductase [Pseudotabrizicola algicola]|uniref:SDR family oxidoreductase n=1 Tax=Pseudotabrizicola algicola TaxID=2709381 RepID=A0A6B3RTB9_9RHOB|nr:SDR family oxidoreductase [Pseudotabrizicola algicola]NEX48603.1 SDR family oxidoreductase [Pseudotabrizicola algicola]
MHEIKRQLAMVTGAAGTLGQAITRQLVADGHRVIATDLRAEMMDSLVEDTGGHVVAVGIDVSDSEAVEAVYKDLLVREGPVSILVNNAGILSNNKAVETTPEEWRRVMSVNLDGAFYLSRQVLGGMKDNGWGRIVNICSLGIKTGGLTAGTAYAASKGGLGVLTFSLARESAAFGVTVNGIAPGYVLTPMVTEQLTQAQRDKLLTEIPVGRFCRAEEVAHLVAYLAGPHSGFITGEIVDMNGGLHMD